MLLNCNPNKNTERLDYITLKVINLCHKFNFSKLFTTWWCELIYLTWVACNCKAGLENMQLQSWIGKYAIAKLDWKISVYEKNSVLLTNLLNSRFFMFSSLLFL